MRINVTPISKCQGRALTDANENNIADMFVHRHVVGILTSHGCKIFDLKSGIFLDDIPVPKSLVVTSGMKTERKPEEVRPEEKGGLWKLNAGMSGTNVGLWGLGGLWALQSPKVTRQAEFLIKSAAQGRSGKRESGTPRKIHPIFIPLEMQTTTLVCLCSFRLILVLY